MRHGSNTRLKSNIQPEISNMLENDIIWLQFGLSFKTLAARLSHFC